jgi:ActR/RegA family two-component response regulator
MTSPTRSPSDLDCLRVLIVEDSWEVGTGLKRLLETRGASVIGPAPTTADAMRLISGLTPDVAIVDINLRGGELAYELIDRLHERGIRTVVLTGYCNIALAEGKVATILQKPVKEELLIASLRSSE